MFRKRQPRQQAAKKTTRGDLNTPESEKGDLLAEKVERNAIVNPLSSLLSKLSFLGDDGDVAYRPEKKKKRRGKGLVTDSVIPRPTLSSSTVSIFGNTAGILLGQEEELVASDFTAVPVPIEISVTETDEAFAETSLPNYSKKEEIVQSATISSLDETENDEVELDSSLLELLRQKREAARHGGRHKQKGRLYVTKKEEAKNELKNRISMSMATSHILQISDTQSEDELWETQQVVNAVGTNNGLSAAVNAASAVQPSGDRLEFNSTLCNAAEHSESLMDDVFVNSSAKTISHPILQEVDHFSFVDTQIARLQSYLSSVQFSKSRIEHKVAKNEKEKLLAAEKLEKIHETDEDDDSKLKLVQALADYFNDMSDFMTEKKPLIEIACEALIEIESEEAQSRCTQHVKAFEFELHEHGGTLPSENEDAVDEFGRSRTVAKSIASHEGVENLKRRFKFVRKRELTRMQQRSNELKSAPVKLIDIEEDESAPNDEESKKSYVFYHKDGSLMVAGKDGWMSDLDSFDSDDTEDDEIDEIKKSSQRHFTDRENFCRATAEVLSDIDDEFASIETILRRVIDVLRQSPQTFEECFINLEIREIISLLVRWDLTLWDPFVTSSYWDIQTKKLMDWDISLGLESLRWYTPIANFVLDVEQQIKNDKSEDNLMSFIIFKEFLPRLEKWIINCWNPLSLKETNRIVSIIHLITIYKETPYLKDLDRLLQSILLKFVKCIQSFIVLPPINAASSNLIDAVVWRAAKLAKNISKFEGLINNRIIQTHIWEEIVMNRLHELFENKQIVSKSIFCAFIIMASSPDCPSIDYPLPASFAIFLSSLRRHFSFPSDCCIVNEYSKLNL